MKTRIVAAALLLAIAPVAGGGRIAFAQADDPTTKAARARFQEGVDFFDKGQFENARAAFLQAYALRKHPAVLLNLAQSSLRSGHSLEAAKFFAQYLHEATSITTAQRNDAEKGLAESRSKLGRIDVSAATGSDISIDGDHVGNAPLTEPVDVEPGPHKVTARAPDGTTDTRSVVVTSGQISSAKFGAIQSSTVPPAGTIPAPPETATPNPDNTPPPPSGDNGNAKPPPASDTGAKSSSLSGPSTLVPVFVGIGVGAAGFITAIILAVSKSSAQSNATSVATDIVNAGGTQGTCVNPSPGSRFYNACNTLTSDNNNINSDATGANVGLAFGIAGTALAVGWLLFGPRHTDGAAPTTGSTALTPVVGPHLNGLSLTGSF